MSKKEWGNAIWNLFHILSIKLKPEHTPEIPKIVEIITGICEIIPCPICQEHSVSILSKIKNKDIYQSQEALIKFVWRFHNIVNSTVKNPIFNYDSLLPQYSVLNTIMVIKTFIHIMRKQTNPTKKILYSFHRNMYMKTFTEYMSKNIHKFNL